MDWACDDGLDGNGGGWMGKRPEYNGPKLTTTQSYMQEGGVLLLGF